MTVRARKSGRVAVAVAAGALVLAGVTGYGLRAVPDPDGPVACSTHEDGAVLDCETGKQLDYRGWGWYRP